MSTADDAILELIRSGELLSVRDLSERTGLSVATVYRALNRLQSDGRVSRLRRGTAVQNEPETLFNLRLKRNVEEKREIARKAINLIDLGDAIFLDASTTCVIFAQELARSSVSNISVVTNSTQVVNELADRAGSIHVICTGGDLQPGLVALASPLTRSVIEQMHFQKAFLSGAAFSLEKGLMTTQIFIVEVLTAAARSAAKTVVLLDSSKFEKQALLTALPKESISTLVSDSKLPDETRRALEAQGIEVL